MLGMVGPETLVIVLVVVALIFGASKIPQIARNLGQAQSEFKKGLKEGAESEKSEAEKSDAKKTAPEGDSEG